MYAQMKTTVFIDEHVLNEPFSIKAEKNERTFCYKEPVQTSEYDASMIFDNFDSLLNNSFYISIFIYLTNEKIDKFTSMHA